MAASRRARVATTWALAVVLLAACADDVRREHVEVLQVVEVTSQRCDRPTVNRGNGTSLGDGRVLTAAHLVDGDLRDLRVDDRAAEVIALDARLDLALLRATDEPTSAPTGGQPTFATDALGGPVEIVTSVGARATEIRREITLRVDHLGQRTVHERPAVELAGAVERGVSGAPVIGPDGSILGVVVLSDPAGDVSFAVRIDAATLGELGRSEEPVRRACPGR